MCFPQYWDSRNNNGSTTQLGNNDSGNYTDNVAFGKTNYWFRFIVTYDLDNNTFSGETYRFSTGTFVVKLASGIAALVASVCLAVFKIQEQSNSEMNLAVLMEKVSNLKNNVVETIDTSAVFGLRMVMTLTPIFILVIALMIFKKKYILTDKKIEEITAELKSRS